MSTCSHALYLALTQDLSRHLPNLPEVFSPKNISSVSFLPLPGVKGYAAASLVKSMFKKNVDNISSEADAKAYELFIRMNKHCSGFTFDVWDLPEELIQVFSWAKSSIDNLTHPHGNTIFEEKDILEGCDFGPGSSVLASGQSFVHKTGCSRLSATDSSMYSFYLEFYRGSPSALRAEKIRRDEFGKPVVVNGSKLCFVPKTSEISRTICIEPSLNMFIQKGLAAQLERALNRSFSFDLRDQQFRNKRLARVGSKFGTMSTIDLSSASDTISNSLCDYLLPRDILSWLQYARSARTSTPDGVEHELHMISSMGNAFTFPLQTIIFSAIAYGVYKVLGIDLISPTASCDGNLGVFGDDIVIRSESYGLMCRALGAAGFFVNVSKSFNVGLFRESCGGDYFDGHNVRGVYCRTLKTTHDRYSLINRLLDWSANNGILLTRTIALLLAGTRFLPVPPWESDIAGVRVPLCAAGTVKRNSNHSFVYRRLQARSICFDVSSELHSSRYKKYRFRYNADAIVVAAVKGTLRGGQVSVRMDAIRPSHLFGVAPCWDYIDMEHSRLENVSYATWKQATLANLQFGQA